MSETILWSDFPSKCHLMTQSQVIDYLTLPKHLQERHFLTPGDFYPSYLDANFSGRRLTGGGAELNQIPQALYQKSSRFDGHIIQYPQADKVIFTKKMLNSFSSLNEIAEAIEGKSADYIVSNYLYQVYHDDLLLKKNNDVKKAIDSWAMLDEIYNFSLLSRGASGTATWLSKSAWIKISGNDAYLYRSDRTEGENIGSASSFYNNGLKNELSLLFSILDNVTPDASISSFVPFSERKARTLNTGSTVDGISVSERYTVLNSVDVLEKSALIVHMNLNCDGNDASYYPIITEASPVNLVSINDTSSAVSVPVSYSMANSWALNRSDFINLFDDIWSIQEHTSERNMCSSLLPYYGFFDRSTLYSQSAIQARPLSYYFDSFYNAAWLDRNLIYYHR